MDTKYHLDDLLAHDLLHHASCFWRWFASLTRDVHHLCTNLVSNTLPILLKRLMVFRKIFGMGDRLLEQSTFILEGHCGWCLQKAELGEVGNVKNENSNGEEQ